MNNHSVTKTFIQDAFKSLRHSEIIDLRLSACKQTYSRSVCNVSEGTVSIGSSSLDVFLKTAPCAWKEYDIAVYAASAAKATESPSYAEIKMFGLTNRFNDLGICDHFAYSYNDMLLKKKCDKTQ